MVLNLFEGIVGNGQAPNHFWLVLDIPYRTPYAGMEDKNDQILNDLGRGELSGVKGISDSKEILTNWWTIGRNAAIMMSSDKVVEANDIEQVEYSNPDHLCQNNLSVLFRLYSQKQDANGRETMMHRVMDYFLTSLLKVNPHLARSIEYRGALRIMSKKWMSDPEPVETASDLAAIMYREISTNPDTKYSMESDYKEGDFEQALVLGLQHAGRIYADEREWIVHSPHFTVPRGSVMMVAVDMEVVAGYDEWKKRSQDPDRNTMLDHQNYRYENYEKLIANIEAHNLRSYYTVKMIDAEKFEKLRPVLNSRRRTRAEK
jgi:hypothetical protein